MSSDQSQKKLLMAAGATFGAGVAGYLVFRWFNTAKTGSAAGAGAAEAVAAAGAAEALTAAAEAAADTETKKKYHFYREDFGPLELMPLHYDLTFDMHPTRVRVISQQTYMYNGESPVSELKLNSHDVKVSSVQMFAKATKLGPPPVGIDSDVAGKRDFVAHVASFAEPQELKYFDQADKRKLVVTLSTPLSKGEEIVLRIVSECYPDDKNLEGIYFDFTPDGKPQQMITQCQQYGFQRIVPCIDRMPSKTYYTTTIIADEGYNRMITNGDLAPGCFDPATNEPIYQSPLALVTQPVLDEITQGRDAHTMKALRYYNHKVNMAPYLFFLGVGTYEAYDLHFEYPDGTPFVLELLCLPNVAKPEHAKMALKALYDSVMWTYLECGPEATEHAEEKKEIYTLLKQRDALKTSDPKSPELVSIRARLAKLMEAWKETGYKYTGQIYREIAMENSNYGGMENVGNTTILSSRLTPSEWLSDGAYVYMEGVKIHEFYHNINGSQVTGQSPFEIWLNEAVTVHIQRKREDALFGHAYMRLNQLIYANAPSVGPLASDRGPTSMAVEPEGFNSTHELVSAMTYSKAPEFVRMCELILGQKLFDRALENYHQKYAFGNATTSQWVDEMAVLVPPSLGVDLQAMADCWLKRTGYPTLRMKKVTHHAPTQTYTIEFEQTGFEHLEAGPRPGPWIIPINWALVKDGRNTNEGLFFMTKAKQILVVEGVSEEPDFASVARDWSFFGTVQNDCAGPETVRKQAMSDTDTVNRYLAYRSVAEKEKAALVESLIAKKPTTVSSEYLSLFITILQSSDVSLSSKALFLVENESIPSRPDLNHRYRELAEAKSLMLQAAWDAHHVAIVETFYSSLKQGTIDCSQTEQHDGLAGRLLMHVMLGMIATGLCAPRATPSTANSTFDKAELVKQATFLLKKSAFMSDKMKALSVLISGPLSVSERNAILAETKKAWTCHPIGTEVYISTLCTCDCDDQTELVRELIEEPFFEMALSGHARSVARGWIQHRKRALLDDKGLQATVDFFLKIGKVNQMSAYALLGVFGDFDKFEVETKTKLLAALNKMKAGLDPKKEMSLFNQISIILDKYKI